MKKNIVAITTVFTFGLTVFATPALSDTNGLNFIFAISGNVEIKRPRWTGYKSVNVGTLVNSSDKLRLTKGASAKVFCTNLSIWNVRSPGESSISQGCPSNRTVIRRIDSSTSFSRGRYSEAEPLYKQVLEIRKHILRDEHLDVATSFDNLAFLYENQGRYSEAELLYKIALETRKRILGNEHPHVAVSLNNLADLYEIQGRYSEAEPLYRQALRIFLLSPVQRKKQKQSLNF